MLQHGTNRRILNDLKAKGFRFVIDANGYQVWHNDTYVHGASVHLPRSKSLHWKHARANIEHFTSSAISAAQTYMKHHFEE